MIMKQDYEVNWRQWMGLDVVISPADPTNRSGRYNTVQKSIYQKDISYVVTATM